MQKPLVIRQHPITIAPDIPLAIAGMMLMAEMGRVLWEFQFLLAALGLTFFFVGAIHFICWLGFRLEVGDSRIRVQQCWLHRKSFAFLHPEFMIQTMQSDLDAWLDKGTLIIYSPTGDIITLTNLAQFSQLIEHLPERMSPDSGGLMRF